MTFFRLFLRMLDFLEENKFLTREENMFIFKTSSQSWITMLANQTLWGILSKSAVLTSSQCWRKLKNQKRDWRCSRSSKIPHNADLLFLMHLRRQQINHCEEFLEKQSFELCQNFPQFVGLLPSRTRSETSFIPSLVRETDILKNSDPNVSDYRS